MVQHADIDHTGLTGIPEPGEIDYASIYPVIVQRKAAALATIQNQTITLDNTPITGNRIVLFVASASRATTSVTQTNVTWTLMDDHNFSTTIWGSIYVGVVGGSPGTVITINHGSSASTESVAVEIEDQLTPTAGTPAEAATTNVLGSGASHAGPLYPAAGTFLAGLLCENDATVSLHFAATWDFVGVKVRGTSTILSCAIGYANGGEAWVFTLSGSTNADHVSILVPIT